MKEKACKQCSRITDLDVCPVCSSATSRDWLGYVSIIDPEKSETGKKLNITTKGKYALRVK